MSENEVIRDKAFAKRIEIACENHHHAPSGHGRQTWIRKALEDTFAIKVSPEAVRKWFAGVARPRPKTMAQLAQILEVDEAWLSLGLKPAGTVREASKLNALANGAVNLVAGQIQLAGGTIAFSEGNEMLFAIVQGQQHAVTVRLGSVDSKFKLSVPTTPTTTITVIPTAQETVYRFIQIPSEVVASHATKRGGYAEFEVERDGKLAFTVAGSPLPEITDFRNLSGQAAKSSAVSGGIKYGIAGSTGVGKRLKHHF